MLINSEEVKEWELQKVARGLLRKGTGKKNSQKTSKTLRTPSAIQTTGTRRGTVAF